MNYEQVVFIDTETTGLNPDWHEVWEIGLIVPTATGDGDYVAEEYEWRLRPDLRKADPGALRVSRYYERTKVQRMYPATGWNEPKLVAESLAVLTANRHFVGAVPSFDESFLIPFLAQYGHRHAWHYHLIDVEALAVGALAQGGYKVPLPWKSDDLNARLGIEVPDEERHTALGDARWAMRIFEKVMG